MAGRPHAAGLALAVMLLLPPSAEATGRAILVGPIVIVSAANDVSPPLSTLGPPRPALTPDVGTTGGGTLLGPVESFEGIANEENEGGFADNPPDANGAVGPLDYVQWVNGSLAVY